MRATHARHLDQIIEHTDVEPRPYQRRIISKTIDMFEGQHVNAGGDTEEATGSVMIESPTGSGKTIMALVAARIMQLKYPDLVVCWVSMRRNLLQQVRCENVNKGIHVQNFYPTSMFASNPRELVRARREGAKILMVMDECQHDAASSAAHLHNLLQPDWVIGMTATPFRSDSMKLCFSKVIQDAGIHQLIQDGFLSPYEHFTIPDWHPNTVADFYAADPHRWGRSLFYFLNIDRCWQLHRNFQRRGISSDVVVGSTSPDYREGQLRAFRSGEVDCLINCMMLTEGFDEPALGTVWVRDAGKGPTIQMAGRVFRQHPQTPVKNVVQSSNTRWPMIKTASPAQQYLWCGSWRSLKVNEHMNDMSHNARMAIATVNVEVPKWLKNRNKTRGRRWNPRMRRHY